MSFMTAGLIAVDHPLRYPFQIIVSLGQLYGDVLYYATSMFDHYILNLSYSRPEAAYFWGYFVLMNAFWILFPGILLINGVNASWRAFMALAKVEKAKGNGSNGATKANGNNGSFKANGANGSAKKRR
jgi:cholestenol delta-isomerase